MALTECRECGHEVSDEADACPSCGVSDPAREGSEGGRRSLRGCMWAFLGLLGLVLVFGALAELENGTDQGTSGDPIAAFHHCQDAVEEKLRAPSTAEFDDYSPSRVQGADAGGGERYIVRGDVDAENAFGAKVRSRYECEIERRSDGWEAVSVTVR